LSYRTFARCSVAETARKAYLDQKVATDAAAVQRQLAPMLLPKRSPAEV
jgi:hypothetical protein